MDTITTADYIRYGFLAFMCLLLVIANIQVWLLSHYIRGLNRELRGTNRRLDKRNARMNRFLNRAEIAAD